MREKDNALSALGELSPPFVKITLIAVQGSAPREEGCMMLVTKGALYGTKIYGTIGGGALEFSAMKRAHKILQQENESYYRTIETIPLGPNLGQCCGGSVKILYELIDEQTHQDYQHHIKSKTAQIAIPLASGMALKDATETITDKDLLHGHYIMTLQHPNRHLYLYGAGHVARALIYHLQKFDVQIHWADIDKARFPDDIADEIVNDIDCLYHPDLSFIAQHAHPDSYHLVMTHDHAVDLQIIDKLLAHNNFRGSSNDDFYFLGLIGSKTKRKRFQKKFEKMGYDDAKIAKIICPIGMKNTNDKGIEPNGNHKSPHHIAINIISQLLDFEK